MVMMIRITMIMMKISSTFKQIKASAMMMTTYFYIIIIHDDAFHGTCFIFCSAISFGRRTIGHQYKCLQSRLDRFDRWRGADWNLFSYSIYIIYRLIFKLYMFCSNYKLYKFVYIYSQTFNCVNVNKIQFCAQWRKV